MEAAIVRLLETRADAQSERALAALTSEAVQEMQAMATKASPTMQSNSRSTPGERPQARCYWANLNPTVGHEQAGRRPVLVVSDDRYNARSRMVLAMPLTSRDKLQAPPRARPRDGGGASRPSRCRR